MTELVAPRITVTMANGDSWVVDTGSPDMVAWDMTAAKHKWPPFRNAPFLWMAFLAWHASRRKKLLPDPAMSFETFRTQAETLDAPGADDEDDEDDGLAHAFPTAPEPMSG